jgi:hypothetical protein
VPVEHRLDRLRRRREVRDVAGHGRRALAAQRLDRLVAGAAVAPDHHDLRPLFGGRPCDRAADAAAGAGDQHHAPGQPQVHRMASRNGNGRRS